ncbi:FG-GAP-like repeat-containing protein [Flavobacterium sp. K5-23]|uniref:FG-GAP-like repeat-containing protein n=1 Tax=Flavobacterium sp. K5-23 TaxID=2746225 RepID=UPI00201059EC|nr:FG-GAP-like repeat-containing protein [Flavobacterium sp. K5-23]UQD55465.1 VCBS repeat-containing protein [Flavobacterium sp. K5-23]
MKKTLLLFLFLLAAIQSNLFAQKVTLTTSKTTIAEHESTTITATLDAPTDKDVTISLESKGTAIYDQDFKTNFNTVISIVAGGNGEGNNTNQFYYPNTISLDDAGNIYINDRLNHRIQKWAPGAISGITVAGGNGQGSSANQLSAPSYFFVDKEGNVYVADQYNNRIQKWAPGAVTGTTLAGGNGQGSNANQLSNPQKFYIDAIGNIYINDISNDRIQKWTPGAIIGTTVAGGNGQGSNANQLSSPQKFYIDTSGNIYIADFNNHRIQKWAPGAITGTTVAGGNGQGSNANQLNRPSDLYFDATNNIYIADSNNHRIQKWAPGAITGTTVAGGIGQGSNANQLNYPYEFYFDIAENIYIHDSSNYRIQKWAPGAITGTKVAGGNGMGSNIDQLGGQTFFLVDTSGNVYISDQNSSRVIKYQLAPQIVIPAGQTSAQLIVSGIEDELENEGTELIVLKITVQKATLNSPEEIKINLLDNTRTLTLQVGSPFIGLENGAVAWGDYDRDGDQDVAVMGTGNSGAVTKLYENRNGVFIDTNQNFAKLYGGDISWVDLNKDGWIDLVVSGFNGTPQTKVYINDKGTSFNPSTEYGLPQLYSTKMAWGDLDNDGDIDLVISGIDKDEKYVFNILYKEDNQNMFVIEPKTLNTNGNLVGNIQQGFIKGDLKIVDIDLDGDNDIIYNGENSSSQPISNIIYNSYIKTTVPNNYNYNQSLSLKNSVIEVAKMNASQSTLTIISSGVDSNGANQFYSSVPLSGNMLLGVSQYPKLKNGDIAVADYNNDGTNDILFTGEDSAGIPTTKLYFQNTDGNYKESPIVLEGLRNSTANWVDYDMDGDLDLFLTGTSATGGAKSLLYVSNIANKKNVAPPAVSGLIAEDLGNGKIKFKWSAPKDDYSTNLGYVIKLGTTPGGTELSNTESNLTTGTRLITKPAAIYTGFYEMQLNPGKYYWSVQAVDTGLKGGAFSAEDSFTLTYDWKILNQGGIIDRSISGIEAPVIKLADLDNDNDLDLIYANANGSGSQILRFDGKRLLADTNVSNINSFLYTINYINNINSLAVGDINGDGIADVVRNDLNSTNNLVLNLSNGTDYTSTALGGGLFKSKIKIVDMNNDGQPDIVVLGMSTNTISGLPKLWIYEYDKSTNPPSFKKTDASAQIAPLANASFDLGDIDKDQDIDLIITGFSASDGLKCIIYENVTELAGSFTLKATDNNLVAIKDGTTDFIDFDGDGDLDAVFTGTSVTNDIFEIYINKLDEGITTWPRFSSGLEPMRQSKISLGDFNGDGYSDLLYSGITGGGAGKVTKLSEYNPSTSKYTDSAFDVSDIQNAEVVFGDIDGDNDLDFVIVGKNKNYNPNDPNNINGISKPFIFRTYINVRNESAKVLASSGKQSATKKTFSPKSATFTKNDKPSIPLITSAPVKFLNNVSSKAGTYPVELSWLASTDDHTPSAGLTYAIKIGTTPGGENIMGADANTSGKRKVSGKGNVEHNKKWRLSLPVGSYYWSVQAIDASYSGSEFSVPNQFEITANGLSTESFNKEILVKAYPNPTTDVVTIIIPKEYVLEKIEMYNSLGQFISEYTKNTISLQNLTSGNYFLKIFTSGGITTTKVIKL